MGAITFGDIIPISLVSALLCAHTYHTNAAFKNSLLATWPCFLSDLRTESLRDLRPQKSTLKKSFHNDSSI
jgi:hypothetical protein